MTKLSLTPADLTLALRGGFAWLELNSALLDRLNVFPVPDGDTGNNMTSTFASGVETLPEYGTDAGSIAELSTPFNRELTRCSRGNSGFILARFFHGFFEIAAEQEVVDVRTWTEGIANGSFHVNGSLFAPAEGTMISILAAVNVALSSFKGDAIMEALETTVEAAEKALFITPQQLPILARAGVIDSGALGMLCIFRGMLAGVKGAMAQSEQESDYRFEPDPDAGSDEDERITYRYCTEAVVRRNSNEDPGLAEWLASMGNSIALVNESDILKIHIHTNEPEVLFTRLETLGELEHRKVDDMEEQSRLVSAGSGSGDGMTVLAFVPGEGFERIYEDFGVRNCFVYSDTLPSPEEISEALDHITEGHIIVMPNNSNILPSVMAVRDIVAKDISIVPTKNVIQGITACYGFSEDEDAETNVESMSGFLNDATALTLYQSANDTIFGDRKLKKDDWFITLGDKILGVGQSASEAIEEAVEVTDTSEADEVAVYHGANFDPRQLDEVVSKLRNKLPNATVDHHYGGQSRSALIISIE